MFSSSILIVVGRVLLLFDGEAFGEVEVRSPSTFILTVVWVRVYTGDTGLSFESVDNEDFVFETSIAGPVALECSSMVANEKSRFGLADRTILRRALLFSSTTT